jgi:hypothetical protein
MRTFEVKLSGGAVVTVAALDSYEAVCLASATYKQRVVSFRPL